MAIAYSAFSIVMSGDNRGSIVPPTPFRHNHYVPLVFCSEKNKVEIRNVNSIEFNGNWIGNFTEMQEGKYKACYVFYTSLYEARLKCFVQFC